MKLLLRILLLAGAFTAPGRASLALDPDSVRVRVSVKRVLSPSGNLPTGRYASRNEITRVIGRCNDALTRSGANWTLILTEVNDSQAASGYYSMSAVEVANLEANARRDPEGYLWRTDAINIYVVDEITDAGGVCSFPTSGPNRQVIVINSGDILGGSEGWLHEIGHYFNLIHPHEDDQIADTIDDPPLPDPFDCAQHDLNLLKSAAATGASASDAYNVLHNVMGYHCDPTVLTSLQVIRMRRALLDYRRQVREPPLEDPPPVAEIRLPLEAPGGRLVLGGEPAAVTLDGSQSRDGLGGSGLTWRWTLLEGPPGGARFESSASGWARGASGIGYGDEDDLTQLADMRGRYLTVYLTRSFDLPDPARLKALELDVAYDDGFAAYLNGREVARRNLPPQAGPTTPASSSVDLLREVVDLSSSLDALLPGKNRVSIEVHNVDLDSSDLSMHPVLSAQSVIGEKVSLIPSRAVWYFLKGSQGAPPPDWKAPEFDAGSSRLRVTFSQPGAYRFRLAVDDGLLPGSTDSTEVGLVVEVPLFVRGDCNGDGQVDISDALGNLFSLFTGTAATPCADACDTNDDELSDLSDAIYLLEFLFRGGSPPREPFPAAGPDPAGTELGCETHTI